MATWRPQLPYIVLLPLILAAASVLSYYTWEAATRFEELGASSIAHSTLLLVEEKIDRIEQQIISRDNAVFHLIDIGDPEGLRQNWLPLAERVSPSVRAVLILTPELAVVDYVARASLSEQREFLRLFKRRIAPDLKIDAELDRLRHLHALVGGKSYLVSYKTVLYDEQPFVLVAHHDAGYIVREEFPRLFASEQAGVYFNIVDQNAKRIFGDGLVDVADYLVGLRFPTTLYRWRLQATPKNAPLLEQQARQREFNKAALLGLSVVILILGVMFLLYATLQERKLNALKSDFIANVSHELKTPLSVVRMFSEMLLTDRIPDPDKRRKYIEVICRESERLSTLIENVLDFAALERGKQRYARVDANVADIVARGVETVRQRFAGAEIRFRPPPEQPVARVDEEAILLAVVNLLDNAVKYGEGSPIDVEMTVRRQEIRISVRDHGPGIPREETRRVFERFYRVRRTGQAIGGSGIGLSLVKHIAHAHGGRAWAENAADGGAIVSFSVARRRADLRRDLSGEQPLNDVRQGVSS